MTETPSEIVLVGYENGTVRLLPDEPPDEDKNFEKCMLTTSKSFSKDDPETMFCDLCDYRTVKRKLLIQHMTSNHFYPDQQCKICGKRLNKMQLRLHMRFHDLKFVCDYCGKRFGDSKALKNHKNSRVCGEKFQESLSSKKYKCDFCEYRTHTGKLLMIHFRTLHVPKDHQCPKCNKEMTLKQYNSHKNYCNQDYVFCEYCGKRFSNPKYLKAHCKNKHLEETMRVDEETSSVQNTNTEIDIHEMDTTTYVFDPSENVQIVKSEVVTKTESVENYVMENIAEELENNTQEPDEIEYTNFETIEEDPTNQITFEIIFDERDKQMDEERIAEYRCSICSLTVSNLDELVEHMNLSHKDCDSECPICHKLFSKRSLQRHMRYHDKKYICPKCGHGFSEPGLLKAHIDRKSSCLGVTLEELQQDPTYMAKEFPCEFCFYRGPTKSLLTRHIRNNHYVATKDIECPDCGKELTRQQWQSHRKTHMKVKCNICNKWFSDSKFFKIHLENHAKAPTERRKTINMFNIAEPPKGENYHCPECDFQTKERRFLIQHLKVKHAPKEFVCQFDECKGKKFTQTQLRLHQRFHKLSFKCEKCGTGFPDNRDLKRHINGKKCFKIRKSRMGVKERSVVLKYKRRKKKARTEVVLMEPDKVENPFESTELIIKLEPENSIDAIDNELSNQFIEFDTISYSPVISTKLESHPCNNVSPNAVGILECPNCNYETDEKNDLMEHWNQLHAPRDQPCPEPQCQGKLFSKAQLKVHMRFHLNKLHQKTRTKKKSKIGPKFFKDKVSVKEVLTKNLQIPNMCENSWIYRCSEMYKNCDFMTVDKKLFSRHQERIHNSNEIS